MDARLIGRAYTPAAGRGERESLPSPEMRAARDLLIVLADPGLGKS